MRRARTLFTAHGILFLLFIISVSFELNWSSSSIWAKVYPPEVETNTVLFGEPRLIRRDEWLVHTPTIFAFLEHQGSADRKPDVPDFMGPVGTELLTSIPTAHYSNIFRPQFWGFFLFNKERGFSFYWAAKVIGLFGAFFSILFLLTDSVLISVAGTIWFLFSSFVQWWFSTSLPEMVASAIAATIGAWLISSVEGKKQAFFGFCLLLFGCLNFALFFYPPFMVAIAHSCIALWASLALKFGLVNRKLMRQRVVIFLIAGGLSAFVIGGILNETSAVFSIIRETEYPGKRTSSPGTFAFYRYFTQLADCFFSEYRYPITFENICEASGFILIWPVMIPILTHGFRTGQIKNPDLRIFIPPIVVLSIHTSWMSLGMADWLSYSLGLQFSPPYRTLIAPGIMNVVILAMGSALSSSPNYRAYPALFSNFWALIVGLLIALGIHSCVVNVITLPEIGLAASAIGLALSGILQGNVTRFWIAIIALVLPNIGINPLSRGVFPFTESEIVKVAKRLSVADINARWAVYGHSSAAQLLKVSGVRVFNGVSFAPRLEDFQVLDPSGAYTTVYNRYAHISLKSAPPSGSPSFRLGGVDNYEARIHPCDPGLKRIGIRNFLFTYKPEAHEIWCLRSTYSAAGNHLYFFSSSQGSTSAD